MPVERAERAGRRVRGVRFMGGNAAEVLAHVGPQGRINDRQGGKVEVVDGKLWLERPAGRRELPVGSVVGYNEDTGAFEVIRP